MNVPKRLAQLEGELREAGIVVRLSLTPEGVKVTANTPGDRLMAQAELRKRGIIVAL